MSADILPDLFHMGLLQTALLDGLCRLGHASRHVLSAAGQVRVFEVDGAAPEAITLSADMPSMSHGPAVATLTPRDGAYAGEIVFVMGGEWELDFFVGDEHLLRGRVQVRER